jgi:PAS domain S-box-containing protein
MSLGTRFQRARGEEMIQERDNPDASVRGKDPGPDSGHGLDRHGLILRAVAFTAERFQSAPSWHDVIDEALARLGEAAGVSRAYIFENATAQEDTASTRLRREWLAPGIRSAMVSDDLLGTQWSEGRFGQWATILAEGSIVQGRAQDFPESERVMLQAEDIESVLEVPIFAANAWWGFIGFDRCDEELDWTAAEIDSVKTTAGMVGARISQDLIDGARRQSDDRFRRLVDLSPDGILVHRKGLIEFANAAAARFLGARPADQLLGRSILELVHADSRPTVLTRLQRLRQGHEVPTIEETFVRLDGAPIDLEVAESLAGEGEDTAVHVVLRDVSERRTAQDALQASEERYRRLVDRSPDAILVHTAGTFVFANRAAAKLLGAAGPEDLVGLPMERIVHPDYRDLVRHQISEEERDHDVPILEERFVRLDGTVVDVEVAGIPLDFRGRRSGQMVVRDVTDRKHAETERREAQALLEATLQSTADGILAIDNDGRVKFSNARFAAMWRIPDELLQAGSDGPMLQFVLDQLTEPDLFVGKVKDLYRSRAESFDVLQFKDDRVFERYSRPLMHGDELAGRVWSFRDVTERRRAEEERHVAETKYRALVENIPAILYVDLMDEAWTTVYVSPQVEGILGLPAEDYLRSPDLWLEHVHPEDRERARSEYALGRERGEPFNSDYRMVRPDGRIAWIHEMAVVLRDEQGRPQFVQGIMFDVTERERVERELEQKNEVLAALHDTALGLMNRLDLEGLLRTMTARAAALVGAVDGYLYLADPATSELVVRVGIGAFGSWIGFSLPKGQGLAGKVWETGRSVRLDDYDKWPGRAAAFPMGIFRTAVGLPLHSGDEVIGVLGVTRPEAGRTFSDEDMALLERFAELASIALENARLYEAAQLELRERTAAEAALRFHAEILGAVRNAVIATDTSGAITYWNESSQELYGWPAEDALGKPAMEVIGPAKLPKEDFEAIGSALRGRRWSGEVAVQRREGSAFTASFVVSPIRDDTGAVIGSIAVSTDVTEGRLAEQLLRDAELRYRTLVEQIPAIVYMAGPGQEGEWLYVSPRIETLLGYTAEEWMTMAAPFASHLHPDDHERVWTEENIRKESEGTLHSEYRLRRKDGSYVWLLDQASLVHDTDGRALFWHGIMYDITDRKLSENAVRDALQREQDATERLRALDEMKTTFLHAVSHELRTPLSAVLGFALTLQREEVEVDADDRRDMIRRLAANARKLEQLLSDLLDLDRLDRGILEPRRRPTDVAALVRRTVEGSEVLGTRPVRIEAGLVVVSVDAPKVERIVENLLANAAKHTPPRTTVWIRVLPEPGGVVIAVEDEGPGVSEELRESIFEPFYQGPERPSHAPGVGIGLSLVHRFAALHGGRAWVEDRPGGGASFRVFLPESAASADAEATSRPAPRPESRIPSSSRRSS